MNHLDSPLSAFLNWEKNIPNRLFLKQPLKGQIKERTYQSSGEEIRRIAAGLKSLGLPEKSKIAILSKNCAEWIMADLAIMMAGYISVPIYPTLDAGTIRVVLEHSESKVIFIGKLDDYASQKAGIPDIHKIGIGAYGILEMEEMVDNTKGVIEVLEDYKGVYPVIDKVLRALDAFLLNLKKTQNDEYKR